jgi:hypothetical protein
VTFTMELTKEFRERFIKTLQGRDYVLYGGLLELARQRGLKRINTKVIQIPSMDNGMYGVVEAEVETEDSRPLESQAQSRIAHGFRQISPEAGLKSPAVL